VSTFTLKWKQIPVLGNLWCQNVCLQTLTEHFYSPSSADNMKHMHTRKLCNRQKLVEKLEKLLDPMGVENDASTAATGPTSLLGIVWPWSFTSWPSNMVVSCSCLVEHFCQLASKSVHSCSQLDRRWTNKQMDGRTDGQMDGPTDGQPENIMPPPATLVWRRHKRKKKKRLLIYISRT